MAHETCENFFEDSSSSSCRSIGDYVLSQSKDYLDNSSREALLKLKVGNSLYSH